MKGGTIVSSHLPARAKKLRLTVTWSTDVVKTGVKGCPERQPWSRGMSVVW
jgi:hypothetical protein